MSRTRSVFLNTITNYARFGVSVAVVFFLTPLLVTGFGEEGFGLWTLVFSTVGFLGLLDLGFATSTVKFVAECRGANSPDRRNRVLSTLMAAYTGLAVVAGVFVLLLATTFNDVFKIPAERHDEALALLWIVASRAVIFSLPLGVFRGILFGEQKIWVINLVQVATSLAYGLGGWLFVSNGGGLIGLAWLNLGAMLLEHVLYVGLAFRFVSGLRFSTSLIDRSALGEVASFSVYAFVGQVAALVLLKVDPIIVKAFLPLSAVALYGVALKVAENVLLFTKQLANALMPLVAELHGAGDDARIRRVLVDGTRFALAPAIVIAVILWVHAEDILGFWIGDAFRESASVLRILIVACTLAVPQMLASGVLGMAGEHRYAARCAVLAMVLNLGVSLVLVGPARMGLVGVALGTLVAAVWVDIGMVIRTSCRRWDIPFREFITRGVLPPLAPGTFQFAVTWIVHEQWPARSLAALPWLLAPGVVAYGVAFWFLTLKPNERQALTQRLIKSKVGTTAEDRTQEEVPCES